MNSRNMKIFYVKRTKQSGAGLVEVVVALVLSATGILGFLNMQQQSLNAVHQAFWRQSANRLSRNIIAAIHSNTSAKSDYVALMSQKEAALTKVKLCQGGQICNSTQIARFDIQYFHGQLQANFPNGQMAVLPCGRAHSQHCIVISWLGLAPAECVRDAATRARCFQSAPMFGLL